MYISSKIEEHRKFKVVDSTGAPVELVLEANTEEGWLVRYISEVRNGRLRPVVDHKSRELLTYKVHQEFKILDTDGSVLSVSSVKNYTNNYQVEGQD